MYVYETSYIQDLQMNNAYASATGGNEALRQRMIGYLAAAADARANPGNELLTLVAHYMGEDYSNHENMLLAAEPFKIPVRRTVHLALVA